MSTKKKSLKEYETKRHFKSTPEPQESTLGSHKHPLFVVQKHNAHSLHYDFRLEEKGVLKSWAIPKGPSTNPEDKRLAIMTEDHPLDYAYFEGIIPPGNYGAGEVLVWDLGTFKNLRAPLSLTECIEEGKIAVWLEGKKLKGGYALIKTHLQPRGWLFFKMKDEQVDRMHDIQKEHPESVLTHKTIEEIG
jgi:bifunctional non-homologous end joining protein LigD